MCKHKRIVRDRTPVIRCLFILGVKEVEKKVKFVMELDEEPALVFIQKKVGNLFKVYQDGEEVKGIRKIRIDAEFDSATTHEIEFLTGATK